ncbi:MAG TPA: DNA translocase FtsK 4TM domain-containing protein, partial [Flavobacteriaceae bacterium]|nr:DNA translocase FtsK 4TM domain-containing protein [Flavobacteriaceae bacterium]
MAKKKAKSTTKPPKKTLRLSMRMNRYQKVVFGSFLFFLGLALCIAFVSFLFNWQADQSTLYSLGDRSVAAQNWLSKFGAAVSNFFIFEGFGIAAFSIAILISLTGIYLFFDFKTKRLWKFWFWGILVMLWFATVLGFFAEKNAILGGTVGYETNDFLQDYLGFIGTFLLLLFIFIGYMAVRFRLTPEKIGSNLKFSKRKAEQDFPAPEVVSKPEKSTGISKEEVEKTEEEETTKSTEFSLSVENSSPELDSEALFEEKSNEKSQPKDSKTESVEMEVETAVEEEEMTENLSSKLVKNFGEFDPKLELGNYRFPPIELLKDYSSGGGITIDQEELEENKNNIVNTLKNYKIDIAQIKATVGPTVTLYEIVPEAGIRISKIKNLEDDIALSLSALGIRIIAPIPGKGTIGIEVPNKNYSIVSMRSVIASSKFQKAEMELPIAFGKSISNETFVVDLAKMPHMLMAGATGQGKSVGLNAVLTSLLYKKHPAEVKFVLVDPKKVELTLFNKIERHYLAKLPDSEEAIITDNTKVINTLNSLCIEMDNRYNLLKDAMVRNIKEYNAKFKARKLNPENGHIFLPYIVLVIDEFADLIMTAGKEVETPIARLAQLARAIGIHLIIATQR